MRRGLVLTVFSLLVVLAVLVAFVAIPAGAAPKQKATVCHKPGTPAQQTLEIAPEAVPGHLGHGDYKGPCVVDRIIDADGTASVGDGVPGAIEVTAGTVLSTFPVAVFNNSGLDGFDNDGDGLWTFDTDGPGPLGDDLHVEGTTFCATAIRDGIHQLGRDCKVLDPDGSLVNGQPVSFDLEVGAPLDARIKYNDANNNGSWDDGEDIVLDVNNNGVYD